MKKQQKRTLAAGRVAGRSDHSENLRRDEALATIRELILTGSPGFRSGEILSENQLSERLGLTKAPVRYALGQLASEGLVSIIPRVGTQVRVVRPEEVQAIMAMRFAIETIIVGELARTRPDLGPLRDIHAEMTEIANRDPGPATTLAFVRADMAFHAKMAELADGYSTALRTLKDLTSQFLLYGCRVIHKPEGAAMMRAVLKEHEDLLEALDNGDSDTARAVLHGHIRAAVARLAPLIGPYLDAQLPRYINMVQRPSRGSSK